jgi:hypothetical protein
LFVHTHKGVAVLLDLLSVLFEDGRVVGCGLGLLQVLDFLLGDHRFLEW